MSEMDHTDDAATIDTTEPPLSDNDNNWVIIEELPNEEQPNEEQPNEEQPDIASLLSDPPSDDITCSKQEKHNIPTREEEATSTDRAGDEIPLDESTPTDEDVPQVITTSQGEDEGDDVSSTCEEELVISESLSEGGGGLDEESAGNIVSDEDNKLAVLDDIETNSLCVLVPVEQRVGQESTGELADCSTDPSCPETTIQQDDNGILEVIDIDDESPPVETEQAKSEINTANEIKENGVFTVDIEVVDHHSTEDVVEIEQPASQYEEDENTAIDDSTLVSKTADTETNPVVSGRDDGGTEAGLTTEEIVKEEEEVLSEIEKEIEKKKLEDQAKRDAVKGPRYSMTYLLVYHVVNDKSVIKSYSPLCVLLHDRVALRHDLVRGRCDIKHMHVAYENVRNIQATRPRACACIIIS